MAITEKFYITYEELPYKYELLDINDMKNIYTKEVNKKEYPDFETWLYDMVKSGVFEEYTKEEIEENQELQTLEGNGVSWSDFI